MWVFSSPDWMKDAPHHSHMYGFSPVEHNTIYWQTHPDWMKDAPHHSHMYGFSPVEHTKQHTDQHILTRWRTPHTIYTCMASLLWNTKPTHWPTHPDWMKDIPHHLHMYNFSLVEHTKQHTDQHINIFLTRWRMPHTIHIPHHLHMYSFSPVKHTKQYTHQHINTFLTGWRTPQTIHTYIYNFSPVEHKNNMLTDYWMKDISHHMYGFSPVEHKTTYWPTHPDWMKYIPHHLHMYSFSPVEHKTMQSIFSQTCSSSSNNKNAV